MKKSKYKNLRFKTEKEFNTWLNAKTTYKITFEDDGQDFLLWWLDKRGEVLNCEPFQASVWNGIMVDIKKMKKGKVLPLQDGKVIIHKVKEILSYA